MTDYVMVKRSDLLRWAEDFVRDNDPGDDTDVVTPFDDYLLRPPAEAQAQGGGEAELRRMVARLAAHVRPTCGELWAEAERLLNRTAPPSAPVGVEGLVAMYREAFISERARNYRAEGMGVEQARIHAEADVNAAEAALSAEPVGREAVAWRIVREDGSRSKWKDMPPRKLRPVDGKGARIEFAHSQQAIDALQDEVEALRKDAERYRFLRDDAHTNRVPHIYQYSAQSFDKTTFPHFKDVGLDAAIDAARENWK